MDKFLSYALLFASLFGLILGVVQFWTGSDHWLLQLCFSGYVLVDVMGDIRDGKLS